jgi:hypothetical protein
MLYYTFVIKTFVCVFKLTYYKDHILKYFDFIPFKNKCIMTL